MTKDKLTDERLAEMLAGLEGVTPGPWLADMDSLKVHVDRGHYIQDNYVLALCATGDHAYELAPHIARCDPDTIHSMILEIQLSRTTPAPVGEAVAVKPLEWRNLLFPVNCEAAKTTYGDYRVGQDETKYVFYWLFDGEVRRGPYDTLNEAKAAAQADFNARIRSALTQPSPTTDSDVTEGEVEGKYQPRLIDYDNEGDPYVEFIRADEPCVVRDGLRGELLMSMDKQEVIGLRVYPHPAPTASAGKMEIAPEMTRAEYDAQSIEDRLMFSARMSSASADDCQLMDEASEAIRRLRKVIAAGKMEITDAMVERFGSALWGSAWARGGTEKIKEALLAALADGEE